MLWCESASKIDVMCVSARMQIQRFRDALVVVDYNENPRIKHSLKRVFNNLFIPGGHKSRIISSHPAGH